MNWISGSIDTSSLHDRGWRSTTAALLLDNSALLLFLKLSSLWACDCLASSWISWGGDIAWRVYLFLLGLQEQLLSCAGEDFLDVVACFGAGLENLVNSVLLCELDCSVLLDFSFFVHFCFVSNEVYFDILRGVLLDLLEPVGQIGKCLVASHVVSQEYTVSSSVEYPCHWSKWLLTCSIPNL